MGKVPEHSRIPWGINNWPIKPDAETPDAWEPEGLQIPAELPSEDNKKSAEPDTEKRGVLEIDADGTETKK